MLLSRSLRSLSDIILRLRTIVRTYVHVKFVEDARRRKKERKKGIRRRNKRIRYCFLSSVVSLNLERAHAIMDIYNDELEDYHFL